MEGKHFSLKRMEGFGGTREITIANRGGRVVITYGGEKSRYAMCDGGNRAMETMGEKADAMRENSFLK